VAEDGCELVRLADGAIGVEKPLAEPVEGGAAMEYEIVAELGLGEEQPMPAAGLFAFRGGKERREAGKPLLAATDEVAGGQFVGELLQAPRFGATDEGVGALPEVDALLAQAVGEPMMLVEIDPRREWQIGADSGEAAVRWAKSARSCGGRSRSGRA
jgi:hypothetical protein